MNGYERAIEAIERMDLGLRGTSARCPAHDDGRASLSVREGEDGRALLYCHAGCSWAEVVLALGISQGDLFTNAHGNVEAEDYIYTDADGKPVLRVVRVQPKGFYQEHWEDNGWQYGGVEERPLYNLPAVNASIGVFFVEGEKDADLLTSLGYCATTIGGATSKWYPQYSEALAGKDVVVIADNDGPGTAAAAGIALRVGGRVMFPREGKDFTDHYNAGWDVDDLLTHPGSVDSIEWLTLDDEDEEEIEWLMEPIIPKGAYITIYGSAGAGKSYVALALAARLAERGVKTTFYSEENPTRVERRRLKRLGGPFDTLRVASQQGVDWGNDEHVEAICRRDRGQDLILLDSYSVGYSARDADENARAVAFSRVVHRIVRETGAAVLVVDHSGFDDSRLRGASAKGQQADVVVHMKERSGGWRGHGQPYEFRLVNDKASRYENPFDLDGALVDTDDGGIKLRWVGTFAVPGWYDMTETEAPEPKQNALAGVSGATDQAEVSNPDLETAAPSANVEEEDSELTASRTSVRTLSSSTLPTEEGEARPTGASSPLDETAAPSSVDRPMKYSELRQLRVQEGLALARVKEAFGVEEER